MALLVCNTVYLRLLRIVIGKRNRIYNFDNLKIIFFIDRFGNFFIIMIRNISKIFCIFILY